MDTYVINLRKDEARINCLFSNIPNCFTNNIHIFEAINGFQSDIPNWFRIDYDLKGRYGCYQSHLEILNRIDGPTLILEDDCLFDQNFCDKYQKIIEKIQNINYDIFYLGGKHLEKPIGITSVKRCKKTILTHAYIVKNKASAQKIIKLITNKYTWKYYLVGYSYEIDLLYSRLQSENLINAYCIDPWLVYQNKIFQSNTKN